MSASYRPYLPQTKYSLKSYWCGKIQDKASLHTDWIIKTDLIQTYKEKPTFFIPKVTTITKQ